MEHSGETTVSISSEVSDLILRGRLNLTTTVERMFPHFLSQSRR